MLLVMVAVVVDVVRDDDGAFPLTLVGLHILQIVRKAKMIYDAEGTTGCIFSQSCQGVNVSLLVDVWQRWMSKKWKPAMTVAVIDDVESNRFCWSLFVVDVAICVSATSSFVHIIIAVRIGPIGSQLRGATNLRILDSLLSAQQQQ